MNRTRRRRHIFIVWTLSVDILPQARADAFLAIYSRGNVLSRIPFAMESGSLSYLGIQSAFRGLFYHFTVKCLLRWYRREETSQSLHLLNPSTRNSEREGSAHQNKGLHRLKRILLLYIRTSLLFVICE